MSMQRVLVAVGMALVLSAPARAATNAELAAEVRAAEAAFAKTMADRDHAAFATFVAEEAVFFGGRSVQRGRAAVVAAWKPLYAEKAPPFSWAPETVEVLDSGTLALSSGPVFDPTGKKTTTFSSIWRKEADGRWRVIFDKGNPICDPPAPKP
jgi:uncharacterized protein (TIGR02246 family)